MNVSVLDSGIMRRPDIRDFKPPLAIRHSLVQTVLNSSAFRKVKNSRLVAAEQKIDIDAGGGVRLTGYLSRAPEEKGFVILLHGWEGSARSTYMVSTGEYFYQEGFSVFRMNFRDHGDTHHLNEGVFLGTLLEEAVEGIRFAAGLAGTVPVFVMGFSMGGNFAIRIARVLSVEPDPAIRAFVALNPPLDPKTATEKIDRHFLLRRYFLNNWKTSLRRKQELFPERYRFEDILNMDSCMGMTEALIRDFTGYESHIEYFSRYMVAGDFMKDIRVPFYIITSGDDPIISVEEIRSAEMSDNVSLIVSRYGGHCGYVMDLSFRIWYHGVVTKIMERYI